MFSQELGRRQSFDRGGQCLHICIIFNDYLCRFYPFVYKFCLYALKPPFYVL